MIDFSTAGCAVYTKPSVLEHCTLRGFSRKITSVTKITHSCHDSFTKVFALFALA